MSTVMFVAIMALSLALALIARRNRTGNSSHDFFVASGQLGAFLIFFLAAGEIYSTATMVGLPGGIYAKGPSYAIWFLGYILLAYPIGYFLAPRLWEAARRFKAITIADLFRGHFRSRGLELIVALSSILFMLPWGEMQFIGIARALAGLGWQLEPWHLAILTAVLTFTYIALSGVRASAYIAILKDILMVVAIVSTGVAVWIKAGIEPVFLAASLKVSNTLTSQQVTFSITTILFQALGFYVLPVVAQSVFSAKSGDAIRKAQMAMPLYMLMFPLLVLSSYFAINQNVELSSANDAFFYAAKVLLPSWMIGVIAAAASLAGLVVLVAVCLSISPLVTRNLLPNLPEKHQKTGAKLVIAIFLLVCIASMLGGSTIMLSLVNVTYYGISQFFPGVLTIALGWKIRALAIGLGILVGQCTAIALHLANFTVSGFNTGLICLFLNISIVASVQLLSSKQGRRSKIAMAE